MPHLSSLRAPMLPINNKRCLDLRLYEIQCYRFVRFSIRFSSNIARHRETINYKTRNPKVI